ncbi:MAG: glycosyltransferase family 4 protein [Candidatus Aminicenantes bacterium]|nr:glycosyltransferase family 4 protein [Candidatus Aminicenantes bacterium]
MDNIAILDIVGHKAGMDYYNISLATEMNRLPLKVWLLTTFKNQTTDFPIFDYFKTKSHSRFLNALRLIQAQIKSLILSRKQNIKILIVHIYQGSFFELFQCLTIKTARLSLMTITHDIERFVGKDSKWRRRLIYKLADKIFVHNAFSKQEIQKDISPGQQKKVKIVKHGGYLKFVDHKISKKTARKKLELSEKFFYLLFFGQIKKTKGLDILLRALDSINKKVKLIIAGKMRGHSFDAYTKIIWSQKLDSRILTHIRYISGEERELLFKAADALVIPFRKIFQSGTMLMGMSYSLPIIASDLPPIKEIINHGENGLLFRCCDPKDLSHKVNLLSSDKTMAEKLGKNALLTIQNEYSWHNIAQEYFKLLGEDNP